MRTVQVAVPIDSFLRCVALVRGLPATHALITTNDGATMARLILRKAMPRQTPGGCFRSVSASSPLPSLNVCAPRLHGALRLHCTLEAVVRLGTLPARQFSKIGTVLGSELRLTHGVCLLPRPQLMG